MRNDNIIANCKSTIGVRNSAISGSKSDLLDGLRQTIMKALNVAGITMQDLNLVAASGMITSGVGIYEIPHIPTAAGLDELAAASRLVRIPELMEVPVLFIPGVKNDCTINSTDVSIEAMDIMRGEETETIGILERKSLHGPLTMILPGSHTKIIKINEKNQIVGCLTTMAGEIFSTLATNTILADSVPPSLVSNLDMEMILKGAAISRQVGLTRGCFSTRTLSQFLPVDGEKSANFLLGVVLDQDVVALKNSLAFKPDWQELTVIGGPAPLRQALYSLLIRETEVSPDRVLMLDDETVEISTIVGAKMIGLKHREKQAQSA